jgi:hypothetical protein
MSKNIPFILLFMFISGSFIITFKPVLASDTIENSWRAKTPMTQARTGLGVVVDGKIYAIGGYRTKRLRAN